MADINQLDPTSLEAWREKRTRIIPLPGGLAIKMKVFDPLMILAAGEDGVPNPLLAVVNGNTKQDDREEAGRALLSDPQNVNQLREMLNRMIIDFALAPPIKEQGHEDGISVDEITMDEKMTIFTEMMGGDERLSAAMRFPEEPRASLVVAPDGGEVRPEAEPPA
jgi:hypothetical protein